MGETARTGRARPRGDRERRVVTAEQLERLYANYVVPIYRFVYARLGNRQDAEDVTSQVFMKCFQYVDPTASPHEIEAYLYRIARTDIADFWRRFSALRLVPIDDAPAALEVEATGPSSAEPEPPALAGELERILAVLPPNYRRVLEFRFFHGYSIKETARAMQVSEANAKVLQYRAIQRASLLARQQDAAPDA